MRNRNVFRDPRIVTKGNASSIEKKCQTMKWGLREKISPSHFPQKRSRTNRETHWSDHEKNYSLGGSACERLFRRESIGGEKNSALCFAEKRFIRKEAEKNGLLINNKREIMLVSLGGGKKMKDSSRRNENEIKTSGDHAKIRFLESVLVQPKNVFPIDSVGKQMLALCK